MWWGAEPQEGHVIVVVLGAVQRVGDDLLHRSPLVWPDRAVADQPLVDPQLDRRDSLKLHTEAVLSPGEGGQETLT